ncbi:MAG TPA: glycerol-3-phosphate 1-O-acyltransferase PlsY [Leptolyngbyaceae cyanobacterium M65_K2018_010]|nr:glycerol-3-phosphate 1-O-acyltransferase PlsY [Leptolyngbyaceae cyanobacterium M65_K2018_010]
MLGILVAAYLLGSFPTGYLVARGLKGIDIRQHGSGGTGATNVLRTVGKGPALLVFGVDLLKGTLAVLLARALFPLLLAGAGDSGLTLAWQPWLEMVAGLLALLGHSRSVWLGFTGGKSVATGLGVLLALAWPVALGALGVFALTLGVSRIVSLGSILAAIATGVLMLLTAQPLPYLLLAILGGGYVVLRHRGNLQRLLAGTEPRLGQPSPSPPAQPEQNAP